MTHVSRWVMTGAVVVFACTGCRKAPAVLEQECESGKIASCYQAGVAYSVGARVPMDRDRAGQLFLRACESRDQKACVRARAVYEEDCGKGMIAACADLATMYLDGFGVPQDAAKAAELFGKACDGGGSVTCSTLALLYSEGRGVAKDDAKAASLWKLACERGFADACGKVAVQAPVPAQP